MSDRSTILSLPYIQPAQAQKHVTHNEALRVLDLAVQLSVTARDLTAPPPSPAIGARHIVAPGASGDWSGQDGMLALYEGAAGWQFTPPLPGWCAFVLEERLLVAWDGSAWASLEPVFDGLDGVGINATSDTTNRLSVASPATLLSHEGQGHQLKINKAGLSDTASLLFQTNWSGRAEMGTAGSDGFALKVSADGGAWLTALEADPASGVLHLPQGARIDGAVTGTAVQASELDDMPGRLMTVGAFGLGAQLPVCPGGDLDLALPGSYCKFTVTDINKPGPANSAGMVRTMQWSAIALFQEAHLHHPGTHDNRVYTRTKQGDDWGAWQELFTQNSLLGPVSQSAGLPTGAVIERGSGAAGEYVRFADGTQICTHETAGQPADTALGALWQSPADTVWTYPLPFAAPPVVTAQALDGASWGLFGACDATSAACRRVSAVSDSTGQPLRLMAVGRWV